MVVSALDGAGSTGEPQPAGLLARLQTDLGLGLPPSVRAGAAAAATGVPLPSRLSVAELAWSCVAVAGFALSSAAAAERAGSGGWEAPDPFLVAAAYRSHDHLRIDGRTPDAFAPLSGFWRTADGWVRTHGNYPHHAASMRAALSL